MVQYCVKTSDRFSKGINVSLMAPKRALTAYWGLHRRSDVTSNELRKHITSKVAESQ